MLWNVYLRNRTIYIPTVAQTEAGFFLDIEPVEIVAATDEAALLEAIIRAIRRGNPRVPTPTRAEFPAPVVLRYAKVKSWSAFERDTSSWTILEKNDQFQIKPGRKHPDGGWDDDPTRIETFPTGTDVDEIGRLLARLVRSEATRS